MSTFSLKQKKAICAASLKLSVPFTYSEKKGLRVEKFGAFASH